MAVTRIKNNQVTDATLTGGKLVNNTVTAGKLEDNLSYGSNLTVTGNLTVQGATNTISATNTTIEDAVIVLNSEVTGAGGARDMGLYGERGDDTSVFMGYDESADLFIFAQTDSVGTATAINPTDYVGIRVGSIAADDAVVATGNVTGGNLITGAQVVATGNVTGGNLNTGASVIATGNVTGGNLLTGAQVIATGNVTGGNLITAALVSAATLDTSGEATLASAVVEDLTAGRVVLAGTSGAIEDSTNLTFNGSTLGVTGAITASTTFVATGNVTGGNLITAGLLAATGNITGGNLVTSAKVVAGSLEVGAITVSASKTLNMGSNKLTLVADPVGAQDAATKAYVDGLLSSGFTLSDGSVTQAIANGDTLTVSGTANEIVATVSATDTLTLSLPDDVTIGDTLTVTGNLVVQGTTTTVNSTVSTVTDPIFQVGRGADNAALLSDDAKDRGMSMYYFQGTEKIAFMGFDTTDNTFKYITDATISSEVVSGSAGTAEFGSVVVDNLTLDANSITSTNTNGNVELVANGSGKINLATGNELVIADLDDAAIIFSSSGELTTSSNLGWDGSTLGVTGAITASTTAVVTGNVTGGNLITAGLVVATGNVTGGNLNTGAQVVATGNVNGGNLVTTAKMSSATITTTGEATLASAIVSDLTAGRVVLAGTSGAIEDSTNLTFNGTTLGVTGAITASTTVVATGNITGGNLVTTALMKSATITTTGEATLASAIVSDLTATRVTFAGTAGALEDNANFTTTGSTLLIGGTSATTGVDFKVDTTNSAMLPIGNTSQRPATGVTGMLRFNTTSDTLEQYASTGWEAIGALVFTTIASQTFNGDASTVAFTLSEAQTTASCIVSINGVVQLPTTAYAVSSTTLTFTEAPATGDVVEVRKITTTTTVTVIESAGGEASMTAQTSEEVDIKGNLMPTVHNTYSIGNAAVAWTTVYAKATSAEYADLAENYEADAEIEAGTVVHFGGEKEVSVCDVDHCTKVAGVVSTDPAYRMNDKLEAEHVAMVALTGRVPCKVTGPVAKGDMMVSAGNGMARAEANPTYGAVIGKALANWEGGEGVIEVVIK